MWRRRIYHPEVNYALRQTLVLCLPVAVGLIIGHLQQGLLFSLVPACLYCRSRHTRISVFKRLIIGGSLFAGCSWPCSFAGPHILLPLILERAGDDAGVTAEISSLHARFTARLAHRGHLYP